MQKIEPPQEAWDKKKLGIALVVFISIITAAYWFLPKPPVSTSKEVAGVNTQESELQERIDIPSISFSKDTIKTTAQEKLDSIKQQVQNLKVQDIASSSPQVQKVINDLKSLQNYPKDQAKQMCENICKNL